MQAEPLEAQMPSRSSAIRQFGKTRDVERVRQAGRADPVLLRGRKNCGNAAPQFIAEFRLAFLLVRQTFQDLLRGGRHPDDHGDVLSLGATFAFMRTAELNPVDRQAGTERKETHAFRHDLCAPKEALHPGAGCGSLPFRGRFRASAFERLRHLAVQQHAVLRHRAVISAIGWITRSRYSRSRSESWSVRIGVELVGTTNPSGETPSDLKIFPLSGVSSVYGTMVLARLLIKCFPLARAPGKVSGARL
jgi:hypothetical protein